MKFNEKLIELRKKEGLSQEELGYKLNVTRQTVSKWELGQTTPEMDKLVEMSKIFNVSVDELVNESEVKYSEAKTIEDQPIQEKKKNNKIVIIIIIAVMAIILMVVAPFMIFEKIASNILEIPQNIFSNFFGMVDELKDDVYNEESNFENEIENIQNIIKEDIINSKVDDFNSYLESMSGRKSQTMTFKVLDKIITNNKKEDRKITVKYMEIETQNPDEIKDIKLKLQEFAKYEISYDYDEEGFINKASIEKVENEDSEFFNDTQEFINNIQSNFENFNF